jgi:hypothetical protein
MLLGGIRTVIRAGAKPRPADLPQRIVENLLRGGGHARFIRTGGGGFSVANGIHTAAGK